MKKTDYDVTKLVSFLNLYDPKGIRKLIFWMIFFITFLGVIPLIGDPFVKPIFYAGVFLIIAIDIWGIVLAFDVYRWQKTFVLYFGIWGLDSAIVFYIAYVKLLYYTNGVHSLISLIIPLVFLISLPLTGYCFLKKSLLEGNFDKPARQGKFVGGSMLVAGIAMFIAKSLTKSSFGQIFVPCVFLLSAFTFEMLMYNIYKYYLIKRYEQCVIVFEKPKR